MEPHLYFKGLKEVVQKATGFERIHIGIRPYGFHAGNVMALIVYPFLLCKYLRLEGKEPHFNFFISLNDWEQDCLDGPDIMKHPFNIYPKNTSLQFYKGECGCCEFIMNHWKPIIAQGLNLIKEEFKNVNIQLVPNSSLRLDKRFKDLVLRTLKNPEEQAEIIRKHSGKKILEKPLNYGGAVCPKCQRAHGKTEVLENDLISWACEDCGFEKTAPYEDFYFWWYHKPMLLARLKIFEIDLAISGGDHYSEGDFSIRRELIQKISPEVKEPEMLFTPTLMALDGRKMSKSKKNHHFADIVRLIELADGNYDDQIYFNQDMLMEVSDEKEYSHYLQSLRLRADRDCHHCA